MTESSASAQGPKDGRGRAAPTIWVIDDDPMILESVQMVLESEDYHVETSANGALIHTLDDGARSLPDLILLDVILAGESGLDLCQVLKERPETRDVPVVLFSANSRLGPQVQARCGDAYLAKPFDIDDLIDLVRRYTGA